MGGVDTSHSGSHPVLNGRAFGCPTCGLQEGIIKLLTILDFIQKSIQSLFINSGFREFYFSLFLHSSIDDRVITKLAMLKPES